MAELYAENKKANSETADAIIKKLIEKKNYIPPSESVHREYAFALLEEYRKFINRHSNIDG